MTTGKRILALALCAMMFLSLLPGTASAESAAYYDETGGFHFSSYAQLKKEVKNNDYLVAYYDGTGALTIPETVTIPAGKDLHLYAPEVVIAKGATVTLSTGGWLDADGINKVTVNGKLIIATDTFIYNPSLSLVVNGSLQNSGDLSCSSIAVKGSLENSGYIDTTSVSGADKIKKKSSSAVFWLSKEVGTASALEAVAKEAAANTNSDIRYWVTANKSFTLSKSLTIPYGVVLEVGSARTLTLAKGATLTNRGQVSAFYSDTKLSIKGTFDNQGALTTSGGTIALEGGTYKETGGHITVHLPLDEDTDKYVGKPKDYLPGFNLNDFDCIDRGDGIYTYTKTIKTNGWIKINNDWYYFKDGKMVTNAWAKDSKGWCYLGADGKMVKNTWQKDSKGWCYLKDDGRMAISQWVKDKGKWYYMDAKGYMTTGWQKVSGKWYYMEKSGAMKTGWLKDGGKWYYLKDSGAMATGWQKVDGKWYYLQSSGAMKTGWLKDGGKWYYLDGSGAMVTGSKTIGGKTYKFNGSGVCQNP